MTGGEGWGGHTSPLRAKRAYVTGGAGPSQTQRIDEPLSAGRGQPVGPLLATSSDGGGIAADPLAARLVQGVVRLRPCIPPVPSGLFPVGCPSRSAVGPIGGLAML